MRLTELYSWVLVCVVVFGLCANSGRGENFITWDDLKVEDYKLRLDLKIERNRSNVIVVDQNGGGDSLTVQGAVDMVPDDNPQRVKIYVRPGIYREKVQIPRWKPFVSLIGDQSRASETIITWNNKAADLDEDGNELGTYKSASVTVESDYFCATGITFENSVVAAPGDVGKQAVALRVAGDRAMFYKVRILGTQDTLLDDVGTHYYYQSYIQGSIDFIFGYSKSLYQDCTIHSIANRSGAIAAHHRDSPESDTGFSFVNCTINGTGKIFLGRAWGNYSRIIYSFCDIDDIITPRGWSDWGMPFRQRTAVFGEYECRGRGADRSYRVPWSKAFSYPEASLYLDTSFIQGKGWLKL